MDKQMKNKYLICSLQIGKKNVPMWSLCQKTHIDYCNKYNIDYLIFDRVPDKIKSLKIGDKHEILLAKTQLFEYIKSYDKICYIDADILITPKANNIFTEYDDLYNRSYLMDDPLLQQAGWTNYDVEWPETNSKKNYYNGGVWLINCIYDYKFDVSEYKNVAGGDELFFNYIHVKNNIPIKSLDIKYNKMCMDNAIHRHTANFIHYAGLGWTDVIKKTERVNMEKNKYKIANADYASLYLGVDYEIR
jgi:lipopolysaccharide biosynthesis glycosyltransferase